MSALATRVIATEGELAGLTDAWWSLWWRTPDATPFQCPAWLLPWWKAFCPGRLHVIAVLEGSRLAGLAPLYLEQGGTRLLPVGVSLSDYGDVLVDPGCAEAALTAISRALASSGADWQTWCMPDLPPASRAAVVTAHMGAAITRRLGAPCPVLALQGADGMDLVPASKRRKLRMARHRVARAPSSRWLASQDATAECWWAHLSRLHGLRWRQRGKTGVLDGAAVQGFHRQALDAMLHAGVARLHALAIDGEVVGVFYGFHAHGRAYAYIGGFDPAAAYYSPGTALIGAAIEAAHREGACELHFLRGGEPYKYDWGAADRWNESMQATRGA